MKLVVLTLLFISLSSFGAGSRNCAREHLRDAIKLNKLRKDMYAKQTNGKSREISRDLINIERISLLILAPLDWRSASFQKKGLPLLCEDFIDMAQTPSFSSERKIPALKYSEIETLDITRFKNKLKSALDKSLDEFIEVLEMKLHELEKFPSYNCLTRHLVESLLRSAHLVEPYRAGAERLGLKDPKSILYSNLNIQIFSLNLFYKLDQKASGIQEDGVAILCQDVPPIEISTREF